MAETHHQRTVGYSMIAVAASLALIGILHLAIGQNVLTGDGIQRAKTAEFEHCKETNFAGDECRKYDKRLVIDQLDSGNKIGTEISDGITSSGTG
ncbi:MAG: hypothetical protein ACT4NJ_06350 [Nitrosopumilaceae archaeon]